jgi:IPT/TIG domain
MMYPTGLLFRFALTCAALSAAAANVASAVQPVITSFSPQSGPVGTIISLTGSGFTGANFAHVDGWNDTSLMILSDTSAHVTVPTTGNGPAMLSISNPTNTGYSSTNFVVTGPAAAPVINSFSPTSGPIGTIITIIGSNLAGAIAAQIGSVSGAQINGNFGSSVQLTVPNTATAGAGVVSIRTAGGWAYSSTAFQVTNNPPSILNNTAHIVTDAILGLNVLGIANTGTSGPTSNSLAVNQTCAGDCVNFLSVPAAVSAATTATAVNYAAGSTTPVTESVPYQIINQSSTGYEVGDDEYLAGMNFGLVYSQAYCGTPAASDYPPVSFVTVLPNNDPGTPVGSSGCGYAQGIEFSIPVSPMGCTTCSWTPVAGGGSMDVSSPSATTEAMSAVLAALKTHHPEWSWGDIKSVLRTTASNWATGYVAYAASGPAFGYGNIDYPAADGYTGQVYLQPPGVSMVPVSNSLRFTVFPFLTSRRVGEVVYAFTSKPVLPLPNSNNEYSYAQISALASTYGGSIYYTSTGLSNQPLDYYVQTLGGTVYLIGFTVDHLPDYTQANFSRAEQFSILGPF